VRCGSYWSRAEDFGDPKVSWCTVPMAGFYAWCCGMIESLVAVGLLLVLVCLTYAIGALLLRRVGGWTGALEKAVFAIPIGMGVVSYVMLALGPLSVALAWRRKT